MASAPTVLNTSCNLLITGISASIIILEYTKLLFSQIHDVLCNKELIKSNSIKTETNQPVKGRPY